MSSFPLFVRCLVAIALLFGRVRLVRAGVRLHLGTWRAFIDYAGEINYWRVGDPSFRSIVWSDVVCDVVSASVLSVFRPSESVSLAPSIYDAPDPIALLQTLTDARPSAIPRWRPMERRAPDRARYVLGF